MNIFSPPNATTTSEDKSRLIALLIAGLICFATAITLGYGAWYSFGTHETRTARLAEVVTDTSASLSPTASTAPVTATPIVEPGREEVPVMTAPAGELKVAAATVETGGDETGLPARREYVGEFAIAETETTNGQYQKFIQATNRKPPSSWVREAFPENAADLPVTGVSWQDAVAYCEWLSKEINATVRLPTEAEWTLAARGTADKRLYPWGDEWREGAALSQEDKGEIKVVRAFPEGRSPVGAFAMAGNVWEWTNEAARDAEGRERTKEGVRLRIVKGGSIGEPRTLLTIASRAAIKETSAYPEIGFRYVVVRREAQDLSNAASPP